MTTTTLSSEPTTPAAVSPKAIAAIAAVVLAAFTAFSLYCIYREGYTGFLLLAGREVWGMQMLLDLVLAAVVASGWVLADARRRRITAWPFVVVTMFLGSIGILAYLVRRAFA